MLKFTPRRHLTGGLRLPPHKAESTERPILRGLVPPRLVVSTRQQRGAGAVPIVAVGEAVVRGQTLARRVSPDDADVHAPSAGRVVAIEAREVPLVSGVSTETCIVIETDGFDGAAREHASIATADALDASLDRIASAGIVGLGGAIFPTAAKLRAAPTAECKLLIINGAECEPYISCDDMLMRESPEEIILGADLLRQMVGAPDCVIAIERDKPQAIDAITAAAEKLKLGGLAIAELPSIYPAGGERQLVEVLAGIEVPSTQYPGDLGFPCQNVGTAHAVYNFFRHGEALTSRIVTVTGAGVAEPRNVEAMIGTPISDLIDACGGYSDRAVRMIHGGSMMGYALADDALPVTKATNCIVVAEASEVRQDRHEWPCIRCGECAIRCPARLQPQDLLIAARSKDAPALAELALDECIECGCCDVVCPSHILLTESFRQAKPLLRLHGRQREISAAAEERFLSREQRREDIRNEEALRRDALKSMLERDDERERMIRAAVERARRRKRPTGAEGG